MKKIIALAALPLLFALGACRSAAPEKKAEKPLVITAKSRYQIVYPDKAKNPGTTRFLKRTALKLQSAFKGTLGVEFPVTTESKRKPGVKTIFLGATRALKARNVNPLLFKDRQFFIRESKGNIYLAGCDKERFDSMRQDSSYTCYILDSAKAAVVFMEKFLDTRFVLPGEVGTDYVKKDKVVIPANFEMTGKPNILYGTGRNYDFFYDYANSNMGPAGLKSHGGHSYYDAVPKAKYGKTHPEYFAMGPSGKRDFNDNHLCIGNPEVQKLIYDEVIKCFDEGAEVTELAQTDGYNPCHCQLCKKYGNTDDIAEKLWILHRDIAAKAAKARPGKKVMIISYYPTKQPPKTFTEFPENVMIELCSYSPANLEAWKKVKVPQGFICYIYNWGFYNITGFTPKRTPEYCAEQARMFLKYGIKGIYRCGMGENFGLDGPDYYVYGKVLENPARPAAEIAEEYYTRAFHESAGPMREFFKQLYSGVAVYSALQDAGIAMNRSVMPRNPRVLLNMIYPAERLDSMDKLLTRAEKTAKDPKVRKRLALVRDEFDYVKHLLRCSYFYNAYRVNPTQANFDQVASAVEARNAFINSFYDKKGRVKRIEGWPEIPRFVYQGKPVVTVNGRLAAPVGTPYTWNIANLKAKRVLPGTQLKKMTIARAEEPVKFGDFNSGAWKKAKWHNLEGLQLEPLEENTRFKMLYDAKNLYVAAEAEVQPGQVWSAVGRDGAAWRQDAIELFLDPAGQRESNYQFIWNPMPNSYYDSATGFIKDVIHPLYGKADVNWNPKWSYQTRVEGKKWYSMATIPFAELKAKVAPGVTWTLNVGREIRMPKQKDGLGAWSPNFETRSLMERDAFGEAAFE